MKVYSIIIAILLTVVTFHTQAQNNEAILTNNTTTYSHNIKTYPLNMIRGEYKLGYEYKLPQANQHSIQIDASIISKKPNRNHESGDIKGNSVELQYRHDVGHNKNNRIFIGGYGQMTSLQQDYDYEKLKWGLYLLDLPTNNVILPGIKGVEQAEGTRHYTAINMGFVIGMQKTLAPNITAEITTGLGKNVYTKLTDTNAQDNYLEKYESFKPRKWANSYRPIKNGIQPRFNFSLGFAF